MNDKKTIEALYTVKKLDNEKFFNLVSVLLERLEHEGYVESTPGGTLDEIILSFETINLLMIKYPAEFKNYRVENPIQ